MSVQYPPPQPGQPPHPPQHPGGYPPAGGYPPHGHPGGVPRPGVESTEGWPRRFAAIVVDLLLAAFTGAYLAQSLAGDSGTGVHIAVLLGCATGVSFVNQVVLAFMTRWSVGKLLFFLRFVRDPENDVVPVGGYQHPPFWRLVGRWVFGLTFLIRAAAMKIICDEAEEDGAGILIVGRRHMLTSR